VNHKYKADVTDSVSIITLPPGSRIMAEYHMHNENSTKNDFKM